MIELESSQDKTVRYMIDFLSKYEWLYQYSIFIDVAHLELDDAKELAKTWLLSFNDSKFRDYLRKRNPNVAMMYVLRKTTHKNHSSGKRFQQFYITIFTTDILDGLDNISRYASYPCNVINRKVKATKIESTCNALKKQALHDLSSLVNRNRYSILNKSKLVKKT